MPGGWGRSATPLLPRFYQASAGRCQVRPLQGRGTAARSAARGAWRCLPGCLPGSSGATFRAGSVEPGERVAA